MLETTIGRAFKLKSGSQLSAKNMQQGKYPVFGGNGISGYHDEYIFEETKIVIGRVGAYCGNVQKSLPKSWITDNALYIDKKLVDYDDDYLVHLLKSLNLNKYASQSGQPLISNGRIKDVKIPLPPLPTQKKIAAILDEADRLRQLNQQVIDKYDALSQSVFLEMFGDPRVNNKKLPIKLGKELFKFSSGKYNPTKNLNPNFDFPTYGGNGITGYSKNYLIESDTIVIGRVGAYCGSIHKTSGKSWVTDNAIYIKEFKKNLNLYYVFHFFKKYNLNRFADYSGQPKITQKPLENMKFIYPTLSLQTQFADRIKAIEVQKAQAQAVLQKSEDLFNSLLQRAFKGELVQ